MKNLVEFLLVTDLRVLEDDEVSKSLGLDIAEGGGGGKPSSDSTLKKISLIGLAGI
jgi:hypothetical protein